MQKYNALFSFLVFGKNWIMVPKSKRAKATNGENYTQMSVATMLHNPRAGDWSISCTLDGSWRLMRIYVDKSSQKTESIFMNATNGQPLSRITKFVYRDEQSVKVSFNL